MMLFAAFCLFGTLHAEGWVKINQVKPVNPQIQMIPSSSQADVIKFNINAYNFQRVVTPEGLSLVVSSSDASPILKKGAPNLPKLTASVIIPNQTATVVEVLYSDYIEFQNIDIAPSKGSIKRNVDPEQVPYVYGAEYNKDEFFPNDLAKVNTPYILRDFRGQTVEVYPFRYNPVKKILRVYNDITVRLNYTDGETVNALSSNRITKTVSADYQDIYKNHFLNFSQDRYTPLEEGAPGRMLIISYGDFMDEMAEFVTWKREKGIETEMIDVSTIGNASAIKTYIANEYNTNGLDYVLLVGDATQVTTNSTGDDSDNEYVYILGNDHYADCFIGRISAESGADVTNQIDKVMQYERDYSTDNSWLENGFCSASVYGGSGQGDDGESDVEHMQNIATDLEGIGYTVTHVNETGGSNAQISAAFNAGLGVANYVGHGAVTEWVNTSFSNTEVNALTNNDKYPFVFSVACVNGDFKTNTCFAEAWLRATNGVSPSGAVAFLGSTINQSWNEPMDGQDEMIDLLVNSYVDNVKRTFGGISFNGMFHMLDEYISAEGPSMADTWTIFGDPSMMVRTKNPTEMTVSHLDVLNVGQESFTVSCNVEGALVSLTKEESEETVILGTGYVSGGSVDIDIEAFTTPGSMKVTATAFDKVTYQQNVLVIVPDGPYVVLNNVTIDDASENNNEVLNNGESVLLNVTLENVGVDIANSVSATAECDLEILSVTEDTEIFGNIVADASVTQNDAYAITLDDGVEDQTIVPIDFTITDTDSHTWNATQNIIVNSPALTLNFLSLNDASGNGNGILDPGETVDVEFELGNNGHNSAVAGNCNIVISENATTVNPDKDVALMPVSGNETVTFTVNVSASAVSGSNMPATITYTSGEYSVVLNVNLPIGLQMETWESNDFNSYAWENDAAKPWTIDTEDPYEGTYCSKSGDLEGSEGTSTLSINLNVTSAGDVSFFKKVSCEDVSWGYYYDFLAFYIDGSMKDQWAGEIDWAQHTYSVTEGQRELSWTFEKDNYVNEGSDCAWVDEILLPSHDQATIIQQQTMDVDEFSFEIMPNPVSEMAYFDFSLTEKNDVRIDLIDINGRLIETIYNQGSQEGIYHIAYDVNLIPAGLYIVRLNAGNIVRTEQIVISK